MSEMSALYWTACGIGALAALQAIEFARLNSRTQQVWPWPGASAIEGVRFIAGVLTPIATIPALITVFVCHVITLIRFRGTFNGGSDAMFLHLLIGFAISCLSGVTNGLGYIAAVLIYSYVSSGLKKLRRKSWRDGTALKNFLNSPHYEMTPTIQLLIRHSLIASWAVILFEVSFPLSLIWPHAYIAIGILFHLGNAYAFGLNRFFWTWICAYPALAYAALQL